MRKPFNVMVALVLILGNILPGVRSASLQTVSADASPPLTASAPTRLPVGPDAADQPLPTPPSPDDLPPEVEQARVRRAAQAVLDKYADYYGPRYRMAVAEVAVEGEWAYAVGQPEADSGEALHLLAHRGTDGAWQALMPGGDGLYLQWVDAVPESLVPADDKSQLRTQAAEADALRQPVTPSIAPQQQRHFPDPESAFHDALSVHIQQVSPNHAFEISNIYVDQGWAYAVAYGLDASGQRALYEFIVLLARQDPAMGWCATAPGVSTAQEYNAWLDAFPVSLLDENTKAYLHRPESGVQPLSLLNFGGHRLPWPVGQIGTLTKKDNCVCNGGCGGTGHENQVDFAIPGDVFASRPGTVAFVKESSNSGCCDFSCWRQANMVVIQHGSDEYSWYVHLAYNSVPVSMGQAVGFGTKIGVEGNTGYACGAHLHYMASTGHTSWTDPGDPNAAPWATGITAVDFAEVSWADLTLCQGYTSQNSGTCSAPSLQEPSNDHTETNRTVFFRWDPPSTCPGLDVYTFRVVDDPARIDSGPWIKDYGIDAPGTDTTTTFDRDGDFWWAVWPCRGCKSGNPNYGERSAVWHFRIDTSGPPPSDWHVEYYSDNHLGSKCHDTYQNSTYVFGDWGGDAPAGGCPSDYFSARFSRSIYFPGGDYTFALGYDDGARIKVDGQTVVDGWAPSAQHYETRNLSSGDHNVEVEYYENTGDAYLTAFWWGPGFDLPRQSQDNSQWYAQYWGNRALWWDPVVRVNEGQGFLNHQWDYGGPGYNMPEERFSSRFERTVHFTCGRWRFNIFSDDGVRFWVGGNLVLDEWRDQAASFSPEVDLSSGDHQLRLEHYENGGSAAIQMSWEQVSGCTPDSPSNLTVTPVSQSQINLTWNDNSDNEDGFRIYRYPPGGTPEVIDEVTANVTSYSDTGLPCGTDYWYYVTAYNGAGESYGTGHSRRCTFPCTPELTSPAYGATIDDPTPRFDWNQAGWAEEYQIQVDDSSDFSSPVIDETISCSHGHPSEYTPSSDLSDGTWHWRVRTFAWSDWGNWSSIWSFTVVSPPAADFDAWPQSGDAPLTVAFHNTSSGDYTSCYWEYGDGSTGNSCDGYHNYTYDNPGTHTVRLTVNGPGGSDTRTRYDYITVNAPPPTADFDAWPQSGDAPLTVAFHNTSSGDYTSCYWEYGDGNTGNSCDDYHDYTYDNAGTYTVRLTVNGPGGSDTRTRYDYITVNPVDTEKPVVHWIAPVGDEEVYHVGDEVVQLEVNATDNVAVARVRFFRWDAVNEQWVEIGNDYSAPYQMNLDCSTLNEGWNQVFATVYDTSGNVSDWAYIWLDREPTGPLVYSAHTVDDDDSGESNGNGDGIVNCGETIELYVDLYNQGSRSATGVNATISTGDPYVTWLYNTDSGYPDIPGGGTGTNSNDFDFALDPSTPDGHVIHFDLDVTASNGGPWSDSFDVSVTCVNNPPNSLSNPTPADGATGVSITADLSWTGGDPDAGDTVTYDVYFEADDSTPDNLICNDVASPTCDPGTLAYDTHYYWYAVATDNHGASSTGDTWDFTTGSEPNNPPYQPDSPTPADGATGESITTNLSWTGGDPDLGDTVTYDVYLEANESTPGNLICDDVSAPACDPGTLAYDTHYYWYVVATDNHGASSTGDTWDFTTCSEPNNPPYQPGSPAPGDGATGVSTATDLSWTGGDPDAGDTVTYDVYFEADDSTPDNLICNDVASPTCDPGTLAYDTHYYWYAVATDNHGASSTGDTWDFTTGSEPKSDLRPYAPPGYPYPVVPSSIQGTHEVNTLIAGQPTYFDWHFINSGDATASGSFHVELWVDDTRYVRYPYSSYGAGWSGGFDDWMEVIPTPGWHTVRLLTDPDDTIAESDETNNTWEYEFYWIPTAPYTNDVESGTNDWTATGLWHQVDQYTSPYPESHSWSHSWWYGQDGSGDYDTGSANSGHLTSPPVYIPSTGYYLRFWSWYETETHGGSWDTRWVQISVDGGAFDDVLQLAGDPMQEWIPSPAIDLSPYAGSVIQFRFAFDTVDDQYNNYRGWYVDDFSISTAPPPTCSDSYEPNNWTGGATSISYGDSLDAQTCPQGDLDFYTFSGTAGERIIVDIDAEVNGSYLDSYVYLLDSDGTTYLAESDDAYGSLDSYLVYDLPHDGTYYVKVRAYGHPNVGGPDYFYTIHLLTDNVNPTAEITSPASGGYLDPTLTIITADASDSESGVNRVEFLWHDGDWENPDWTWLGADSDGSDGWSFNWVTSAITEQTGIALYIWAFDWAGNWTGAGSWSLTLDRTPPSSSVDPLPASQPSLTFTVSWSGEDLTSGVAAYDVQYRDGADGAWTDWLIGTDLTSASFTGQNDHTYYFRSRARDHADNWESYPTSPDFDTYTTVYSTYTISGHVRDPSSNGIGGVTVDFGGAQPAVTTGSGGYYIQSGFSDSTYTVTFSLGEYAFSPVVGQVTVSGADVTHNATGYPFNPASLPFSDDFESGGLGSAWAVETDYEGRVRVDSAYPYTGSYSLLLDDDADSGFYSHASAILALDLSGQSQVEMSFWWREFLDENHADDGVFISDDYGATWYQVFSFNDGPPTYTQTIVDLDAGASAAGISLNDHFLVKFQFYDDYPIPTDGYAIDDVQVYVPDTQAPTGSILINDGDTYANDPAVNLTLSASDNVGVTEMNLNYNGGWQGWEAHTSSRSVTLTGGDGTQQVDAQYRDAAGNASSTYSDTIILDLTPPSSSVDPLPASQPSATFAVSWSGYDLTSGIAAYDVQVREDGGPWSDWMAGTPQTMGTFAGDYGRTYCFRSRAYDQAGNVEDYPGGDGDTCTSTPVPPTAAFSATPLSGTLPLTVTFTNLSSGTITDWLWDFGDGGTSTLENPTHTYTAAGVYTATLTVSGPAGSDVATATVTVYGPPGAAFTSSSPDWLGQTTAFTNTTTGQGPITYTWSFGDGGTSILESPTHTYTSPGIYTAVLTATNSVGSGVATDTLTVYGLPMADFIAHPTTGFRPLSVVFTDTTITTPPGDPTLTYLWVFGDGGTGTLPKPTHIYTATGVYTVTLTVSNGAGSDTITRTHYVTVSPAPVQADFTAWPTTGPAPLTTVFANASTGDYIASLWDFGDSITSTLHSPTHTYAAVGAYTVTLTISGPGGSNTETKAEYITVKEEYRVYLPLVVRDG